MPLRVRRCGYEFFAGAYYRKLTSPVTSPCQINFAKEFSFPAFTAWLCLESNLNCGVNAPDFSKKVGLIMSDMKRNNIGVFVIVLVTLFACAAGGDKLVFLPGLTGGQFTATLPPTHTAIPSTPTMTPLALSATPLPIPSVTSTPTPSSSARWVDAYYVGYEQGLLPINEIDFSALTHLMVGRITPLSDGSVNTTFDIDTTNGPIFAKAAAQAAHAAGRKAILMLGGAGEHAGFVGAASDQHRAAFVQNILARMDEYGYDGIDMDWEPVDAADRAPLKSLIHDLRIARPNMLLTMPVGFVNANFPGEVDAYYAEIAQDLDQMNIMTYGMSGNYDGWDTWHFSPLFGEAPTHPVSIDHSAKRYAEIGVPKAKLGIGAGFYGTCWRNVTQPGESLTGKNVSVTENDMSYAAIVGNYLPHATANIDATNKAPYLSASTAFGPNNCNFVGYDNEASIAAKGAYVRAQGLSGVIIWTIGMGHIASAPVGQRDPLMDAIKVGFLD